MKTKNSSIDPRRGRKSQTLADNIKAETDAVEFVPDAKMNAETALQDEEDEFVADPKMNAEIGLDDDDDSSS